MNNQLGNGGPMWGEEEQGNFGNMNVQTADLRFGQTGGTMQGMYQPQETPARVSRWEGMNPRDIPFTDHDTSIHKEDRFPYHPYGPVVPGPEHVNPATGGMDMDKYWDMVDDRFAVGRGDESVLEKYRNSAEFSQPLAQQRGGYTREQWTRRSDSDVRKPGSSEDERIRQEYLDDLDRRKLEYEACKEKSPWYRNWYDCKDPLDSGYTYQDFKKDRYPNR